MTRCSAAMLGKTWQALDAYEKDRVNAYCHSKNTAEVTIAVQHQLIPSPQ